MRPPPAEEERRFPNRNESYERYRLALGPYRAGKRVATNVLDASFEDKETEDGYRVDIDDEYDSTAFHDEVERWLNTYREFRERCDNRDGEGEPGSLPLYKEEWPEPPKSDGAMLTPEAAAEIGIDYANSDPIFFPRTDDGDVYSLPLPDGRRLTVDGIVEAESPQRIELQEIDTDENVPRPEEAGGTDDTARTTDTQSDSFEISLAVVEALRTSTDGDDDIATVTEEVVIDALSDWIEGTSLPEVDRSRTPKESLHVPLADRHRSMIEVVVEESDRHASPAEVVEAALCSTLDVDLDGTRSYTVGVELGTDTALLLERHVAESDYDNIEEYLRVVATDAIRSEFGDGSDE